MPLTLIAAMILAFGSESFGRSGPVPSSEVWPRTWLMLGWVLSMGLAGSLVSFVVSWHLGSKNATLQSPSRVKGWLRQGSRLVSLLTIGGYAWVIFGIGWPEIVKAAWGWRHYVLIDELAIIAPFLAARVAGWWGLAFGVKALRPADRAGRPFSVGRLVMLDARQSMGMILPSAIIFVLGQDLSRLVAPGRVDDPSVQIATIVASGAVVLSMAPFLVGLSFPTTSMPPGPLRSRLQRIADRTGFRCSDIRIWDTDGQAINAGVTGVFPRFRYVLMTDALVEKLSEHEVAAVFGHEVGHAWHRHLGFFGLFCVASVAALGLVGEPVGDWTASLAAASRWAWLSNPDGQELARGGPILVIGLAYFGLVFGHLSRRFERQADVFGSRVVSCGQEACPPHLDLNAPDGPKLVRFGKSEPICPVGLRIFINALREVAALNAINPTSRSWRHGSIARRIAFLERIEGHPEVERSFQSGVRRLTIGLVASLSVVIAGAMLLPPSSTPTPPSIGSEIDPTEEFEIPRPSEP